MKKIGAVLVALSLAACSSAPHEEDVKNAKDLEAAANQVVEDQVKLEDALDDAEAWLEAGKRRELDAYAEKKEAAPVERLRKIVTAERALEDLRSVIREERRRAATVAATVTVFLDPTTSEEERHELGDSLVELRVALKADRREEQVALDRWKKARIALGAEAFGGKPK